VHGASTGQGEGTNGEANNTSGGRPVRHKIPLGILIFLVLFTLLGGQQVAKIESSQLSTYIIIAY